MGQGAIPAANFVSDALFDRHRFRVLTMIDNHTRESLAIEVDQRITETVVRVTNRIVANREHLDLFESPSPPRVGRWTQTAFALRTRRASRLINRSTMNYQSRRIRSTRCGCGWRELRAG